VIAYLAPEIPALSETFVYEELLALERRGFRVTPISVRAPAVRASDQKALAERVTNLYAGSHSRLILAGVASIPFFGRRAVAALTYLLSDILECGPHRLATWKLVYQFLAATKLARILKHENCTHLHVHFANTPAQIAMYASALSGIPFTITAHANDIFERGLLLHRKAERAVRMLTISEHNQRYLESLGIPRDQLAVVRCGVSFSAKPKSPSAGEKGSFRIGTLGRMIEKKGFDILTRAVAVLKNSGRVVELRIAGDGPLKPDLERLAQELGIADITRFEGSLPHHQVADWMQRLDVFVLACKKDKNGDMDGIPVVLMEAMSQSVPVISTRLSGVPELVVHEETGLLAEPNDHDDLARQISRLIESTELCAKMTMRARAHVTHEFGQANNLDRLIGYFNLPSQTSSIRKNPGNPDMSRRYVLISPCRDEADFMRQTLDTVIAQSVRPTKWVIVDDGSTDDTPRILREYAQQHPWIEVVTRSDRGRRAVGPGVIEAFYAGYVTINPDDYHYLCKLDLDLRLPPRYFEILMERMEANPRIATCSGKAYIEEGGGLVYERHGHETSLGMTKFYRVSCFKAIGGFVCEVMWDGIDCHRCRMNGWIACSWDEPDLRFVHLRPEGSSQRSVYTGRVRHGFGQYFMGTGFLFMAASALYRITEKPYVLGSVAMLWGWIKGALQRKPRYEDPEFRKFLHRYHMRALVVGKRRAIEEINREGGIGG
jgi:glycosyltransferase involved in cell wall biosynthesis